MRLGIGHPAQVLDMFLFPANNIGGGRREGPCPPPEGQSPNVCSMSDSHFGTSCRCRCGINTLSWQLLSYKEALVTCVKQHVRTHPLCKAAEIFLHHAPGIRWNGLYRSAPIFQS